MIKVDKKRARGMANSRSVVRAARLHRIRLAKFVQASRLRYGANAYYVSPGIG
jgi:hypothetical protein